MPKQRWNRLPSDTRARPPTVREDPPARPPGIVYPTYDIAYTHSCWRVHVRQLREIRQIVQSIESDIVHRHRPILRPTLRVWKSMEEEVMECLRDIQQMTGTFNGDLESL